MKKILIFIGIFFCFLFSYAESNINKNLTNIEKFAGRSGVIISEEYSIIDRIVLGDNVALLWFIEIKLCDIKNKNDEIKGLMLGVEMADDSIFGLAVDLYMSENGRDSFFYIDYEEIVDILESIELMQNVKEKWTNHSDLKWSKVFYKSKSGFQISFDNSQNEILQFLSFPKYQDFSLTTSESNKLIEIIEKASKKM